MSQKEVKSDKTDIIQLSKLFNKEGDIIEFDNNNCLIYGDKSDFINEDIFFKQKETIDPYYLDKRKSSIDLNLTEKNIHELLNEDLIKALDDDDDFMNQEENCDISDSSSSNAYISGSSDCTSKQNSHEFNNKVIKKEKEININLNKDNFINKNNLDAVNNKDSDININNKNNNINNINNIKKNEKEKDKIIDKKIKDKIEILNDPLFTPIFIPNEVIKNKNKLEKKENEQMEKKKEKKKSLKNKFDDDVETLIMMSITNFEEKTKLPLEIRVGDWICLYCNNLNFSFRIKCNRCGLLRKSTTHLLNKKYYNNKYQYLGNNNNYNNDNYSGNFNMNYDLNYNNNFHNNNM